MNWFDTSGLTSLAKTALKEAQKTIDKALDIQDSEEEHDSGTTTNKQKDSPIKQDPDDKEDSDFFSSWGLTVSAESSKEKPIKEQPVVTESPSKSTSQSLWGSFAGSFFEQPKDCEDHSTVVHPPKAKSMNVISDTSFGSQDDLFSKSHLIMSEGADQLDSKKEKITKLSKDERRSSYQSNRVSLVSSRNSSDSVEILSQSFKTTPDSEPASIHSLSHSSSIGQKMNSESVEILPDSLVSPSSIECLGFDSYSSDKNSTPSSNPSPGDMSDKKSTPIGERADAETADSVSLVVDDDEDTVSYNSVSECTAPTVLGTDEKQIGPFSKVVRTEPQRKAMQIELIHLDQPLIPQRMHLSENSSNDGSWSDRTLNADTESLTLDTTIECHKRETEHEDLLLEKLSDSSSFYSVNMSTELLRSDSSAFVNVEKKQCSGADSSESSQKDAGSVKERTSPISTDSKSDLVKLGSDRTSGHTSGDELETTTSSDIEIIPSPNGVMGDNGHGFCRSSPAKYPFKHGKFDGTMSPNLVDLVLGKSLATKIRGHNRELSEASIQSNTSDESQSSENERLLRRLCEMAEVLEARENRLMEVSRSNAELAESNANLKSQIESLLVKHEGGDINMITEDYTQRMSALEKKFQQAIREKDQLRKQLDSIKSESNSRKNSSELENSLKEKDDVIAQLQEEGEKLARQQLQHSNIIKKLRTKEKDNEQVIKSLRDKISEQTAELDRLKRSIAAKEEVEVNQIETVYRLRNANKKYETELMETKSVLDDTTQKLESSRTSLEAARRELSECQRNDAALQRARAELSTARDEAAQAQQHSERLQRDLQLLRTEMLQEEKRWVAREESLRRELNEARELCSSLEARMEAGAGDSEAGGVGTGAGGLLEQLAALQRSAVQRDRAHATTTANLLTHLAEAETTAAKAVEREKLAREECQELQHRLSTSEGLLQDAMTRLEEASTQAQMVASLEEQVKRKTREADRLKSIHETEIAELRQKIEGVEQQLVNDREALDTEKKRNAILQEQVSLNSVAGMTGVAMPAGITSGRGESSPHSVASDSFSSSMWPMEESGRSVTPTYAASNSTLTETLAALQRREGEVRALAADTERLRAELRALRLLHAQAHATLDHYQSVQEQYDALLQMYGEKEEQLEEVKLDLQDVTQLYKAQLDELIALKQRNSR